MRMAINAKERLWVDLPCFLALMSKYVHWITKHVYILFYLLRMAEKKTTDIAKQASSAPADFQWIKKEIVQQHMEGQITMFSTIRQGGWLIRKIKEHIFTNTSHLWVLIIHFCSNRMHLQKAHKYFEAEVLISGLQFDQATIN